MEDIQTAAGQVVATAPGITALQPVPHSAAAAEWHAVKADAGLHLATQQVQPIGQAPLTHGLVLVPKGFAGVTAQVVIESGEAIGVEPDHQQLALWRQHPLHFAQYLMWIVGKLQAMVRYHRINTVTVQWQLSSLAHQAYALTGAFRRIDAVVDRAAVQQGLVSRHAHLQYMVTKRRVQHLAQGGAGGLQQIFPVVPGIPGFQFCQNIDTLAIHHAMTALSCLRRR